jgi:hypothetical protein
MILDSRHEVARERWKRGISFISIVHTNLFETNLFENNILEFG